MTLFLTRKQRSSLSTTGSRSGLGAHPLLLSLRRVTVFVAGWVVLIVGLIVFPLPIPLGAVLVPSGLAILASEFPWARRMLMRIKDRVVAASKWVRQRAKASPTETRSRRSSMEGAGRSV